MGCSRCMGTVSYGMVHLHWERKRRIPPSAGWFGSAYFVQLHLQQARLCIPKRMFIHGHHHDPQICSIPPTPPPHLELIPPLGRQLRTRQRAMHHILCRRQQNLRVQMHTGMDPQPHGPPNRLGHLPLVHRPQPIQPAVLDPPKSRHVFGDKRKVLHPQRQPHPPPTFLSGNIPDNYPTG